MPTIEKQNFYRLESIEKLKWDFKFAIERFKGLMGKVGYILTLASSLGLWYGIYALVCVSILDDRQNYLEEHFVDVEVVVEDQTNMSYGS